MMNKRTLTVLLAVGIVLSVLSPVGLAMAVDAPADSPWDGKFSKAATTGSSLLSNPFEYEPPEQAKLYGDENVPGWYVTYENGSYGDIDTWANESDARSIITHDNESNRVLVSAPAADLGVSWFDRLTDDGLAGESYIETVDLHLSMSNVDPVALENGSSVELADVSLVDRFLGDASLEDQTGVAYSTDTTASTLSDGRDVMGATNVSASGEGVTVAVIDTGVNTADGAVFGDGTYGSEIRIKKAFNAITGETAKIEVVTENHSDAYETASELEGATSLDNVSVDGSGEGAYVNYTSDTTPAIDRFDDTDLSEYSGDTGSATVVSSPSVSGSALELTTGGASSLIESYPGDGLANYPERGDNFTFHINATNANKIQGFRFAQDGNGNGYTIQLDDYDGALELYKDGQSTTLDSTPVNFPENQWLEVQTTWEDDGTITVTVFDETDTQLGQVSAVDTSYSSGGVILRTHGKSGSQTVYFDEAVIDNAAGAGGIGQYVGGNHSVSNATSAWVNVTATNTTVDVVIEHEANGNWTTVANTTVTSAGNYTFALSNLDGEIRANATFTNTSSSYEARLYDEGVTYVSSNEQGSLDAVADGNGHGTWAAAAIAANTANDSYDGVAPNATLLVGKALADDGSGETRHIVESIEWAEANGADVISLSLGSPLYSPTLAAEIKDTLEDGDVSAVVIAVGNSRQTVRYISSPADVDGVIGVAATNVDAPEDAKSAYFSQVGPDPGVADLSKGVSRGAAPTVAAPGMELTARIPVEGDSLRTTDSTLSGTSMATPLVAGSLALYLEANPGMENESAAIREDLEAAASPMPHAGTSEVGAGMVNVENLVSQTASDGTQEESRTDAAKARDAANEAIAGDTSSWLPDILSVSLPAAAGTSAPAGVA